MRKSTLAWGITLLGFFAAVAISFRYGVVTSIGKGRYAWIESGSFVYAWGNTNEYVGFTAGRAEEPVQWWWHRGRVWGGQFLSIPLWPLGVTLVAVCGLAKQRKPTVEDACSKCGYSRQGLPDSSLCPECGERA